MARNLFDRPIPGQSLTTPPRNAAWEKPPQFIDVNKAMDYLVKRLLVPEMAARLVMMLDNGAPVEAVVRTVLFGGFYEGKWSMDLAILLAQPVAGLITVIYDGMTGKKPPAMTLDDDLPDPGIVKQVQIENTRKPEVGDARILKSIEKTYKKTGLMGMM